jgi:hypothetical protein
VTTPQRIVVRKQGEEYFPECRACGSKGQMQHTLALAREWCRRHRQVNKTKPECQVQP